ncbi:MAG TPA: hypothetical protein VMS11_07245 [Solirubrobacterales bacterium]|nr:hypothetical protein [Solirubrobacterales bacterium]
MIAVGAEAMNSLDAIPADGHSLNGLVTRRFEVEHHFGSLARVEYSSELRAGIPGDVLIAGRHAEPDPSGCPGAAVEDLQNAVAIPLDEELDAEEGPLGKEPLAPA